MQVLQRFTRRPIRKLVPATLSVFVEFKLTNEELLFTNPKTELFLLPVITI